jgi:hypothetical protein
MAASWQLAAIAVSAAGKLPHESLLYRVVQHVSVMRRLLHAAGYPILASGLLIGVLAWQRYQAEPSPPVTDPSIQRPTSDYSLEGVAIRFEDLAQSAGIGFQHDDGRTPMHYFPEAMGGGVAWLDYDQDGYMDLFLVQGGPFPPSSALPAAPTSKLYRNLGDGTFLDVTSQVGILHPGYGQGVAVGDYDNDGYPDLFLTCYGHCHLYHNEPDGRGGRRFREVTREAGVELDGWCTSCAFADLHQNGYLDLFVCRYLVLDLKNYPFCGNKDRNPPERAICGPKTFPGSASVLFRNNGDGTFTNVSRAAGIEASGKGLGVVILDLDDDGKPDIFVGNDEVPNFHYRNLGHGKFESCGVISGTAAFYNGNPMGSMGVEADDLTGHGRPDLFVSTFYHQGWALFRNNGNNFFTDMSQSCGMYAPSWDKVGWGACLLDIDQDGVLDLFVANGHVYRNAELMAKSENGQPQSFAQFAHLFHGNGKGMFRNVAAIAGPYFQARHTGRGAAMADYDNDGAMDIAVNHCGAPASLLHNETHTPNHWIRLQLTGARHRNPAGSNRDAIGARVVVKAGGRTLVRHIKGGGSYLSAHDRRLLIGIGSADQVDEIEVRWPNAAATVQRIKGPLAADRNYQIMEGIDTVAPALCPVRRSR